MDGKSTLFRLITGLEEASTGQIELTETKSHPVGYMPQKDAPAMENDY